MNDKILVPLAVVVVIMLALLGTAVTLQVAGLTWLVKGADRSWIESSRFEGYVDEQIDAGLFDEGSPADDPLLDQRKILLAHTINARSAKDVATKLIHLDARDHSAPIDLYISTQGGYGDSAFTIIDAMRMIDAPVNTWAIGGCYSAGTLVLAAGTGRRFMTENAIVMIHTNLDNSWERFSYDRLARKRYEKLWKDTARLPAEWFPMTDDSRYYLSPDEALRFGVVDEIVRPRSRAGTEG